MECELKWIYESEETSGAKCLSHSYLLTSALGPSRSLRTLNPRLSHQLLIFLNFVTYFNYFDDLPSTSSTLL